MHAAPIYRIKIFFKVFFLRNLFFLRTYFNSLKSLQYLWKKSDLLYHFIFKIAFWVSGIIYKMKLFCIQMHTYELIFYKQNWIFKF